METINPTRLARLFNRQDALVLVIRMRDFVVVDASEWTLQHLGKQASEVLGKRPGTFGVWTDLDQREHLRSVLGAGRDVSNYPVAFHLQQKQFTDGVFSALQFNFGGERYALTIVQDMRQYESRAESLARALAEYRSFFINAPIGMYRRLAGSREWVQVNPALTTLLGYESESELLEHFRAHTKTFYGDDSEETELFSQVATQHKINRRVALRCKKGERIWVNEVASAISDVASNACVFIDGIVVDQSSLESAQNAAKQQEQLYKIVLETTTDGVFLVEEGVIRYCNKALASALGYGAEMIIGEHYDQFIVPELREKVFQLRVQREAGVIDMHQYELQMLHKNGSRRLFEVRSSAVEIDGKFASSGIMRDVTEERDARYRLQLAEQRFRRLFEATTIGMFQMDLNAKFIDGNGAFAKSLGYYTFAELSAVAPIFEQLCVDSAEFVQLLARARTGERVDDAEMRLIHRQGNEIWITLGMQVAQDPIYGHYIECSAQDVSRRRLAELQLKFQANHDALTRLPNRVRFEAILLELVMRARSSGNYGEFGVILLDLDSFKLINDSLGHAAGDELLAMISERLTRELQARLVLARYGGDEFAIVSREPVTHAQIAEVAGRILRILEAPFLIHGHQVFSSASIGIVLMSANYVDPKHVMRDADIAMYRAKSNGKSRYEVYDADMHRAAQLRLELESDLRLAMDRSEFACYFQPVVDLTTQQIIGAEALVRWQHPTRGLQLPGIFIGVAEESGILMTLDWFMLETAFSQMLAWRKEFGERAPKSVSINISDKLFATRGLASSLEDLLRRTGVPAEWIQLEITETIFRDDLASTLEKLRELKSIGLRLVVDDFGTGYSSLVSFTEAAFDGLKIDRGFVQDIEINARHRALVRTICQLAQDLNLSVVAEGIEREEQAELAQALGCNFAQGFRYAPALPAEAFTARLRAAAE
jgi:diguanylate cyclase (GGDEF)-like protein/PAS domain S-box-containing protein